MDTCTHACTPPLVVDEPLRFPAARPSRATHIHLHRTVDMRVVYIDLPYGVGSIRKEHKTVEGRKT